MAVSDYDKKHLSAAQQATIEAVTQAAQSGSMSWADAHAAAEAVRAQAGYSGGQYGNEYISPGKTSGSGSSGGATGPRDYTGTTYQSNDYHSDAINAAQAGDWEKVAEALNNREIVTGSLGTNYGKTSMDIYNELVAQYGGPNKEMDRLYAMLGDLQAQLAQPTPSYTPSWGDQAYEELLQQAIAMNYEDWTEGDQYKALADRFGIQGKMTMQDVLGQISSRTGGLASSYATTAAQQQYNEYMSQLEEVARQMFAGERGEVIENAGLARDYGELEYGRYLDQLNMEADRNSAALGIINQMMGYQQDKYNQDQNAKAEAQDRVNAFLAAYGNVADLDPTLVRNSGYTQSELDTIARYYADQRAQEQAAASKKNTSSGGGNTTQKPTLTAAQTLSALESGIVNDSTKAAYEYYYGQPWESEADVEKPAASNPTTSKGGDYWLGDGSTAGGKTSLNWDQDEGIFTWNGKNYSDVDTLLSDIDAAGLTGEELEVLKRKFKLFGFDLS